MNIWHDIDPALITSTDFSALIEIPKGSSCKYELDKSTGLIRLDRMLYTSTHYPQNYGFIPLTYADDHDPLDVLVITSAAVYPMTLIRCNPIGVMRMIDSGESDDKIIAVPYMDPNYGDIDSVDKLPPHIFDEIVHFFSVYKQLEGKTTAVDALLGRDEAIRIIERAIEDYREKFGDPTTRERKYP